MQRMIKLEISLHSVGILMKNSTIADLQKPTIDDVIDEEDLSEEKAEDDQFEIKQDIEIPLPASVPKKPPLDTRKVSINYPPKPDAPDAPSPPRHKLYRMMSQVFNRQDKRYPGLGFVQRCMGRARKSRVDSQVKLQLDNWEDHRPFFTWWVSSVQVMVLLVALMNFGIAEFGLEDHNVQEQVPYRFAETTIDLTKQRNFYFGPKTDALIRLGAKYAPCMRRDKKLFEIIECEWQKEERTACCSNGKVSQMSKITLQCHAPYVSNPFYLQNAPYVSKIIRNFGGHLADSFMFPECPLFSQDFWNFREDFCKHKGHGTVFGRPEGSDNSCTNFVTHNS